MRHPPSWFGDGESPKKQGPKTGILQEAAIRRLIQENYFWIPLPQLMQLLRFIQEVGFSRPGPSFSVPPCTNNCFIINLASDSSGGTLRQRISNCYTAPGWTRAGNYSMLPKGAGNHLEVFVCFFRCFFLSVSPTRFVALITFSSPSLRCRVRAPRRVK